MSFSNLCQNYFGSKDLYEILHVSRQASQKEVKRAYHKLSLIYHPDRVGDDEKAEATEKFKVLAKIHTILNDPEKRTIYDETGIWNEEDDDEVEFVNRDWFGYWRSLFNKITINDITQYEEKYKGSEEELEDLKNVYEKCKGDMDKMFQHILFATSDDEGRIRSILEPLIYNQQLPAYDIFVNEPQTKRDRRMRKLQKEAKEAEKEAKKRQSNGTDDLQKAILARRQANSNSFLEELELKYSGPKMSGKTRKKSSRGAKK